MSLVAFMMRHERGPRHAHSIARQQIRPISVHAGTAAMKWLQSMTGIAQR